MKEKIAVIVSGGGMACSYNAGVLIGLIEKYKSFRPDIIIGGSGGAGTSAYYLSRQKKSLKNIWLNLLAGNRKFINPFRFWKIINVDYLIDEIFKKQDPLDLDKVRFSKIKYLIATTNSKTGKIKYFSNKEKKSNILEALRASKAIPIVYGRTVKIGNSNYCDSVISGHPGLSILKAIELGATKILVVENNTFDIFNNILFFVWILFKSDRFRKNYFTLLNKSRYLEIPRNVELVYLKPRKRLRIRSLDNNKRILKRTLKRGIDNVSTSEKLKNFLKRSV